MKLYLNYESTKYPQYAVNVYLPLYSTFILSVIFENLNAELSYTVVTNTKFGKVCGSK